MPHSGYMNTGVQLNHVNTFRSNLELNLNIQLKL